MELILSIYADLTKAGWKMYEIDKMDPVWHFKMIGHTAETKKSYIDDVL